MVIKRKLISEAMAGDHSEARADAATGLPQIRVKFAPNSILSIVPGA
jgi:hypothetical protein